MKRFALSIFPCAFSLLLAIPPVAAGKTPSAPMRSARAAESLSGKILTVKPEQNLVVVKNSDGVPFDMVVTPKTHIKSGDRTITLKDLTQYQGKAISIKFLPERRGDIAESIHIGG